MPCTAISASTVTAAAWCRNFSPIQPNTCGEETVRGRAVVTTEGGGPRGRGPEGGGKADLSGAEQRRHDAHVWREEKFQAHDEDGEDGEGQQLQTVIHQLQHKPLIIGRPIISNQ